MTFGEEAVKSAVSKLLCGSDYRDEVINAVNAQFFDFTLKFFHEIVDAKFYGHDINLEWYREHFIDGDIPPEDAVIYAGLNRKTITNIYGTASREVMIDAARNNFAYLRDMLDELENDSHNGFSCNNQHKP